MKRKILCSSLVAASLLALMPTGALASNGSATKTSTLSTATPPSTAARSSLDLKTAMNMRRPELPKKEDEEKMGAVREMALREVGQALGARIGFSERSREILNLLDRYAFELDTRFNFGRLVIGNNVLPPVISESRDAVSVEQATMRVAGIVYRIDEPARFALPTPTWRNWLWLGLDPSPVSPPELIGSLPANEKEQAYWARMVKEGYDLGRRQAEEAFEANLALLERTYYGMRRYYDLWSRGMVTAPVIANASAIVRQEDENTVVVGDTLFRITAPAVFTDFKNWRPLDAPLQ